MTFKTRLLVSARSLDEAKNIVRCGVPWLDLKEPLSGSLGRPSVELTQHVLEHLAEIHADCHVSVAGGELIEWKDDGDVDFVGSLPQHVFLKVALAQCNALPDTLNRLHDISHALHVPEQLILAHYADCHACDALDWPSVLEASSQLGCRFVLIDTWKKSGHSLLDHCSFAQLKQCIEDAHQRGIGIALAGSLRIEQLPTLRELGPDWVGVRTAVCRNDRTGALEPALVDQSLRALELSC